MMPRWTSDDREPGFLIRIKPRSIRERQTFHVDEHREKIAGRRACACLFPVGRNGLRRWHVFV
jgi:hypothetical protein